MNVQTQKNIAQKHIAQKLIAQNTCENSENMQFKFDMQIQSELFYLFYL